jgi:putative SOS response-associated peptidase YedK
MCGRYSFALEDELIWDRFRVRVRTAVYKARYNCAPGQELAVILNEDPGTLNFFRWGLIPFWAKDPSIGNKMINAKSETITEKPSFRSSFRSRRCLVPATGFYEWRKDREKIPYHIGLRDGSPFSMAGIWDRWTSPDGEIVNSFSILTTTPNEKMAMIHDRMPVILHPESEEIWLGKSGEKELMELLKPFPSGQMTAIPISRLVNPVRNDQPGILAPSGDPLF